MSVVAFAAEKVYDGLSTNITWVVTNAFGSVVVPDTIYLREKGTSEWLTVADFAPYIDATNATIEVKASKTGFADAFGESTVKITKAMLTVTADDQKIISGSAVPGTDFYTFTYFGFVNGEDKSVIAAEPTFGSAYTLKTSTGDIPINKVTDGVAKNYEFTYFPGILTIQNAPQSVTSKPYSELYDGKGHTIEVEPNGGTVTYKVGEEWVSTPPLFTNVVDTTVIFKVTKDDFDDYIGSNTVTIAKRPATITSGTKTDIPYDGAAHTFESVTDDGFIGEDGVASGFDWASVTGVKDGEVANAFEYTLTDCTVANNYEITVITGKIAVVAAPVFPKNPGENTEENPADEPTADDGVTLWAKNVEKVYDGIPTNIIAGVYGAVDGNDFLYEYSLDGATWVPELAITDVTDGAQKVYFRAKPEGDAPNYIGTNAYAFVTITKCPVEISFTAADKVYDGNTIAVCSSTNFTGVVDGETLALNIADMSFNFDTPETGRGKTVTATGYADTAVTAVGDTKKENYSFRFIDTTTASITKATQSVTSKPYSELYDGKGHTIEVEPNGGTVTYKVGEEWVSTPPLFTNVVDTTVIFKVTKDNFEDYIGTNTVDVMKRPLVILSSDGTWKYNGLVHCKHELVGVDGFVAGETYSTNWIGAITNVGTESNEFSIVWDGTAKESNYAVSLGYGILEVTKAELTVTPKGKSIVYGSEVPGPEFYTYDYSGFVNGETAADALTSEPSFGSAYTPTIPAGTTPIEKVTDGVAENYEFVYNTGTLTIVPKSIGPVPVYPDDPDGPFMPAQGFVIPPLDPEVYDGQPHEPAVMVMDEETPLCEGIDYAVTYFSNTNATEEAFAEITGIGNYCGTYTNYFTILPRKVTLRSGTKTIYLDPTKPGEVVLCSNNLVWVEAGSFVVNADTGVLDGFEADVTGLLESSVASGPVDNLFTAIVKPGLATNYTFSLKFGILEIFDKPLDARGEIHEEVPLMDGKGVVDIYMDNKEAGKFAANKPPELNELIELFDDDPAHPSTYPREELKIRMKVSESYLDKSFNLNSRNA